jgi:hypothetical protein
MITHAVEHLNIYTWQVIDMYLIYRIGNEKLLYVELGQARNKDMHREGDKS